MDESLTAKDPRRAFGDRGEDLAVAFFIQRGFTIIARNWQTRVGEIDVICQKNDVIHFIEVKTRRTLAYGRPQEAITPRKLQHLRRSVEAYLQSLRTRPQRYQVDALAILAEHGKPPVFEYIEHIFG